MTGSFSLGVMMNAVRIFLMVPGLLDDVETRSWSFSRMDVGLSRIFNEGVIPCSMGLSSSTA
jgi:hypothetical protein